MRAGMALSCLWGVIGAAQVPADPWVPQPIVGITVDGGTFDYQGKEITVSSFVMSRTEITQNQFAYVMGYNPSWFVGRKTETLPVEDANWYEAIDFCNRLSLRDGLQTVYTVKGSSAYDYQVTADFTKTGWRLPTEAEWIFAAQGGNLSKHYKYAGSNNVDEVAWYSNNMNQASQAYGSTFPVASKAPNELGLYDMSGNVIEWCYDFAGGFPSGTDNPKGPSTGWQRVAMGGAWCYTSTYCQPTNEYSYEPLDGAYRIGIRIVRSLPAKYADVKVVFDEAGPAVEKAATAMETATNGKEVAAAVRKFSGAMAELLSKMNGFLKVYPELTNGSRAPAELEATSDRFGEAQGRYHAAASPKLAKYSEDPDVTKAVADMQKAMAAISP